MSTLAQMPLSEVDLWRFVAQILAQKLANLVGANPRMLLDAAVLEYKERYGL